MPDNSTDGTMALSEQEKRLVQMIRKMKDGELHIYVSDGKPIRVEKIRKRIEL